MPSVLAPRYWGAHLLALLMVAAASGLGWWQWDSYQARRDAEAVDLTRVEPIPLAEAMGPDDPFPGEYVGQPVLVEGSWLPEGTVYVSGREHEGRDGFWVVTPLAVGAATDPALPVVLGWSPTVEEAPAAPTGPGAVTAWLQPTDGTGEADTDRTDDVVPQVRTADLIQHVDQDLYGAFGIATEPLDGLATAEVEQVTEASAFTGLKNLLYGIEWFVFGGFAAFIWWRWSRDLATAAERTEEAAEEAVPSRP